MELAAAEASYPASMSEQPGSDPFGDFQRWLMKAGARSITRDVTDRVKSTWAAARPRRTPTSGTRRPAPDRQAPECQWCPICRAARRAKDWSGSSAGFSGQFAGAADALAGLTRDAFSLFESAMRTPPTTPGRPAAADSNPRGLSPRPHAACSRATARHTTARHGHADRSDAPTPTPAAARPTAPTKPDRTPGTAQTTAPSSDPESGGRPLSIRSTRTTKPPTKAATARKAASPEMVDPTAVLISR